MIENEDIWKLTLVSDEIEAGIGGAGFRPAVVRSSTTEKLRSLTTRYSSHLE